MKLDDDLQVKLKLGDEVSFFPFLFLFWPNGGERDESVECESCVGRLEGKVARKFCQKSTFNSVALVFRTTTFSRV